MNGQSGLDQRWRDALAPLREGLAPAPGLESRISRTLRGRRAGARRLRLSLAAIFLVAVGGLVGRWWTLPPASDQAEPRFILLLFEGPAFDSLSVTHEVRVTEYREWAEALASRGQLVDAAELAPVEQRLGDMPAAPLSQGYVIAGFFVLRARDQADALRIAATCPHLRHGGGVSVRPLAPS